MCQVVPYTCHDIDPATPIANDRFNQSTGALSQVQEPLSKGGELAYANLGLSQSL